MPRKKIKTSSRRRDWDPHSEDTFSRDHSKHLRSYREAKDDAADEMVFSAACQPNAQITSHSGRWATVLTDHQETLCLIDEKLGVTTRPLLAPGDWVEVDFATDQPIIRAIAPRKTKLSRLAVGRNSTSEQVVAANVDKLIIVASAACPAFKPGVVDRYLIAAQVGGVSPLLVLNKADLVDDDLPELQGYRDLGVPVFITSCETRTGIDALRAEIDGAFSVIAGQSGVGKSTLLNTMAPSLALMTQEVSNFNEKGRHTTTHARVYGLSDTTRVIDTPGIRQLGLWGISSAEISFYFPELAELATACKFRNCTHSHEPECAVLEALESGELSAARYSSYRRIRESM